MGKYRSIDYERTSNRLNQGCVQFSISPIPKGRTKDRTIPELLLMRKLKSKKKVIDEIVVSAEKENEKDPERTLEWRERSSASMMPFTTSGVSETYA
jgi:hypothetical protein